MRLIYWKIPILLLLTACLYVPFLSNPIVFDDLAFFAPDAQGGIGISSYHFNFLEIRSLPYSSFSWGGASEIAQYRIGNLILHMAVTSVLFLFVRALLGAIKLEHDVSSHRDLMAFFAALLFSLHPVAVYTTGYLIQRTTLMATLFCLLAMLAYLRGSVRESRIGLWGCIPFYYLAVFSKEHAVMLPAVLLALTILLHEDWRQKLKQRWAIFFVLGLIVALVIAAKKGVIGSLYEPNVLDLLDTSNVEQAHTLSVLTQSWLFFKYALLWLLPNPAWMSIDMREPFASEICSSYLVSFLLFLSWGAVAFWLLLRRGRWALLGFALLFPWLMFMTEFSTVRAQEVFVLYRSYMWSVGAACALPLILYRLNFRMTVILLSALAIAMFPISLERLSSFSHPVLLWEDAEKLVMGRDDLPGAYRIYYNSGTDLLRIGDYDKAIPKLIRAIELKPGFPIAYGNLGAAYYKKGQSEAALKAFTRAIELASMSQGKSSPAKFYYGRAMTYEQMGDRIQAEFNHRAGCDAGEVQACNAIVRMKSAEDWLPLRVKRNEETSLWSRLEAVSQNTTSASSPVTLSNHSLP